MKENNFTYPRQQKIIFFSNVNLISEHYVFPYTWFNSSAYNIEIKKLKQLSNNLELELYVRIYTYLWYYL